MEFRIAERKDCALILSFIKELAKYEHLENEIVATDLEDLFVLPEYRGKGYGKAILKKLAQITVQRGCGRLEWCCLDWNTPSINFYESLKAKPLSEWMIFRVTGDTLNELAK